MIRSIGMRNWKSFKESQLFIDPLTILIGSNASGKSNALDAFSFLNKATLGIPFSVIIEQMRGGIQWVCRNNTDSFSLSATVAESNENIDYIYFMEVERYNGSLQVKSESLQRLKYRSKENKNNPYSIYIYRTDPCDQDSPYITARTYNEKQGAPRPCSRVQSILGQLYIQSTANILRSEITIALNTMHENLGQIFMLDPIPSHMRGFSQLSEVLSSDASNIAGVISAFPEEDKKDLEIKLSNYIKSLPEREIVEVFSETVDRFKSSAMLYCKEGWLDDYEQVIDARGMSDGTLRFLAILTALLTRPVGSLLVIEEIDNGLHPSRADLLIRVLSEIGMQRKVDVLMTTHNPAFLDRLGHRYTPFITVSHRDPLTGSSMLTLLEDINMLPKMLASGPVGTLTSKGTIESALNQQFSVVNRDDGHE